jgi:hypothetical protein
MNSAEIYYDNTASQWSDVQLFVGKNDWNSINPMKKISNTNNLYCLYNFSWGGYSAFYFTTGTASWNPLANNENVDSRSDWATCRSAKQTTSLGSTVNLYISTAATKGASVTRKTLTDYKSLNYKQTVQQQLTTDGSTYSASTEAIATIKVASYRLASATATSATAQNGTIASGSSSANCEAARTATVTYSVSGINSSYSFVGWYDGDTQKSTSATYTYQATEAKTITARFAVATEEEHEVAVSYMCGTTKVADGATAYVGVETEKSFTAPTNITGYKFTNWTIGAGIDLKAGTASDATITVVTKSASSDYTLVANYEEVMETVYFINTNKWARVNIHKWNGKAAASSWPGEKLTASGEKIGEYDVYAYTAKQGDYANVIFNSKTSSTDGGNAQTGDLTWTAGKYYIYNYGDKTGWYTKAEAEELLVVPVVIHDIVVKAVAPEVWNSGTISIHYWGDGISATEKPVATEKEGNWNKYTIKNVPEGTSVNVIFVNGADWTNNANQTANITGITEDKCFQISAKNKDSEGKCTATVVECGATIEPEGSNSLTFNVTVPAGTEACYICGEWDWSSFKEMTKVDATHYTLKVAGAEKTHKYKYACQASWDYVEKKADGNELDGDRTWTANDVVAKWGKPDTYTIAGTPATVFGKEWDATYTANDMKLQEDGTFVWSVTGLELTKTTNVAFKIVKNQNWETAWPAENKTIPVTEDGTYNLTIYFNAAEKDDATKNNGIYISLEKQAVVTPEVYTRTVTPGYYGTICIPYASSSYSGAEFYEVSWLQKNGETPVNLYLNQLAAGTQLEAGKPYIFKATANELSIEITGAPVDAPIPADENNGLTGSFDAIPAGSVLTGNYVVAQNKFWTATATAYADENRAYIDKEKVPDTEQKQIPGRRRVSLGAAGENAETGIDNIITTDTPVKVIENGQLIIIRNGEKFNVQGQKL